MSVLSVRRPLRAVVVAAGSASLLVGGAALANAHVGVSPGEAEAGSYAILTFSVPHGCETSATTEIAIDIPEEVLVVTPTVHPAWAVEKLDNDGEPVEAGSVDRVVYTTETPLPADLRDTFELSIRLPEEGGQALVFPVEQTCEEGAVAWSEVADEGEDPHALEYPAPFVEVVEAVDAGHGDENSDDSADGAGTDSQSVDGADASGEAASDDDAGVSAMSVAGLSTGVAGLVVGLAALFYAHRRTSGAHGGAQPPAGS